MPLEPGRRLGPYEILAPLGAGGMGEVYQARDTRLNRTVAIKVLASHLAADPSRRERFEREAHLVSRLNHPNICTLHDIGSQEETHFLVMEFIEGETLAARLAKGIPSLDQTLAVAVQITEALDKAHRQGVIHRDLKPTNVMLAKTGAKLLDFGLAKLRATESPGVVPGSSALLTQGADLTAEGSILGTLQYMAPEQLEGKDADARSDIFSFGSVMYEMLTGKKAFAGKSQASVIAAILERDPVPLSSIQPMTPPALDRVVRRCLAKDPDERWQNAGDLASELKWIAQGSAHAEAPGATRATGMSGERLLWLLLVVLLAGAGLALGLRWYRAASIEPRVLRAFVSPPDGTTLLSIGFGAGPVAVSPDGSRLVFLARKEDGTESLWVRRIDSLVATPLPGTEGASYPFWSPDGRSIGFFTPGNLKRIDAEGGPALSVCDALSGRGASWSSEGIILFAPQQASGLFRVSANGGTPIEVTRLDSAHLEETHRWPQFLPGGRKFIYFSRLAAGNEANAVMGGSLDGGNVKVILRNQSNAVYAMGHLIFMRETALMAQPFNVDTLKLEGAAFPIAEQVELDAAFARGVFSASDNGVLVYQAGSPQTGSQLIWFDRNGKQTGILGDRALYVDFSISPDMKLVAVNVVDPRGGPPDVWIYEVARGLRTRFTFEPTADNSPVWTPDGSRVVYSSVRKGNFDMYIKSYAGSTDEEPLLQAEYDQLARSFSPDGRYLAYVNRGVPTTNSDIMVLPLFGDRRPIPFLQTQFREVDPQFSPDGHWIAYTSDESGRNEVYVLPFPGPGRKWQISSAHGTCPRWRRDGREIYYLTEDNRIVAVEVNPSGSSFQVGAANPLFAVRPVRPGHVFSPSPDGQRFLVNMAVQEERPTPLTLVVNWIADASGK